MIQPLGVGTIHVGIKDNLNAKHMIELHDVMHMPDAPINILVPQVFIQQCQSKGDAVANCSISALSITLEWLVDSGAKVIKYTRFNHSNVAIAYTASGFKNFKAFASLCGMPAYISDDENNMAPPRQSNAPLTTTSPLKTCLT